ncbi:uncharacterized mitochondrial protein-like protein [Tanacetum coccineum]
MGRKNKETEQIRNNEATVHDATIHATVNTVYSLVTVHETPFHVTSPEGDEDEYENDVTPISEPRNYNEAKLNLKWLKAMKTELESIVKNNTWKLVPLPNGFVPIGLKWLFKIKRNADGWKIHHLDVKTAFLHGELKEEVQAPKAGNIKLDNTLKEIGFTNACKKKQFIKRTGLDCIIEFKKRMASQFEILDLGELTYYLGIEVSQGKDCVEINQERYVRKILKEASMEDCNATSYPMEKDLKLSKDEDEPEVEATQYQKVVGCLHYLLHTHPDLTYSVGVVSRYMQSPRELHARAIK